MKESDCKQMLFITGVVSMFVAIVLGFPPPRVSSQGQDRTPQMGCTPEQRRDELRSLQTQVLQSFPSRVESLKTATQQGGALSGWRLSHGLVVLAGAGAVTIDNVQARNQETPPVLQYAPSPASEPRNWLDFDGEDGPYKLVGWGYIAPYRPGSDPPRRKCIAASEWFVHEAGWHLKDGDMRLTPDAAIEPTPAQFKVGVHFWHPQVWDIHFWRGDDGRALIAFNNPKAMKGGLQLPEESCYYLVNGRKQPPPKPY